MFPYWSPGMRVSRAQPPGDLDTPESPDEHHGCSALLPGVAQQRLQTAHQASGLTSLAPAAHLPGEGSTEEELL